MNARFIVLKAKLDWNGGIKTCSVRQRFVFIMVRAQEKNFKIQNFFDADVMRAFLSDIFIIIRIFFTDI